MYEVGQEKKRSKNTAKIILITALTVLAILGVTVGVIYYFVLRTPNPIPKSIRDQAVFSLYYPSKLPAGYSIDKNSFKYVDRRASYTITSPDKPKILVTIQPKPARYNLDSFANNLPGKIAVATPYGTATVGVSGATKLTTLTAGDNWVLITSSANVSDQTMKQLVTNLKRSD